ncbi:MAG: leucine-rich repeat domain-containing protein, partial [Clostridia bacterium]|nr:leucine-rich repeat domain-containing protein [Clostridia bacterium]
TGLTDLMIANGVTYLETGAFMRCTGLKRAEISNSIVGIGEFTFLDCDGLEELKMPAAAIGSVPVSNLVRLEITSGEYIRYQGFQNCKKLESVVIADSVKVIGESAFSRCDKLTRIVIPNGVGQIGNAAFENCEALTEAVIGNGVTHIGSGAFSGCYALESVIYKGSAAAWALIEIDSSNECLTSATRYYSAEPSTEAGPAKRRYAN